MKKETPSVEKQPDNWFVDGLKKQIVAVVFAVLWAFYTFVYNSQSSQSELKHQVETNTKSIEKLNVAVKELSEADKQLLVSLTAFSESQKWLVLELKRIDDNQHRNSAILNRK